MPGEASGVLDHFAAEDGHLISRTTWPDKGGWIAAAGSFVAWGSSEVEVRGVDSDETLYRVPVTSPLGRALSPRGEVAVTTEEGTILFDANGREMARAPLRGYPTFVGDDLCIVDETTITQVDRALAMQWQANITHLADVSASDAGAVVFADFDLGVTWVAPDGSVGRHDAVRDEPIWSVRITDERTYLQSRDAQTIYAVAEDGLR